jgi:hypothetical protein
VICERTGKRIYTRREALRQARWWRTRRLARMSHYRCGSCDGWHIGNNHRKPKERR